jgi:hypothetical protein
MVPPNVRHPTWEAFFSAIQVGSGQTLSNGKPVESVEYPLLLWKDNPTLTLEDF